jgi:hypothetical protein
MTNFEGGFFFALDLGTWFLISLFLFIFYCFFAWSDGMGHDRRVDERTGIESWVYFSLIPVLFHYIHILSCFSFLYLNFMF